MNFQRSNKTPPTVKLWVNSDKQQSWLLGLWSTSRIQSMLTNAQWGEEDSKDTALAKGEQGQPREGIMISLNWYLVRQCNQGACMENGTTRVLAATTCLLELVQTWRGGGGRVGTPKWLEYIWFLRCLQGGTWHMRGQSSLPTQATYHQRLSSS